MNIIVLVKQVPDTTEIKLDPKTGNLIREGIESIMNPDDRHALEAAVSLKESMGGSVTVVSMGPPQAIDVITEAMGMGADRGILLSDRAFSGADTWATSLTLGKALEKIGDYDLIICGRQAIDGDTALAIESRRGVGADHARAAVGRARERRQRAGGRAGVAAIGQRTAEAPEGVGRPDAVVVVARHV